MDRSDFQEYVYFVNSRGKKITLVSPQNNNYWELSGRSGFSAPTFEPLTEQMADGSTKYLGKLMQPRELTMNMVCVGKDRAELDRVFFDMVNGLIDADGLGEGKLYVKKSDGAMAFINCVYIDGAETLKQHRFLKSFSLHFYAANPYWYTVSGPITFERLWIDYDWQLTVTNPTEMDGIAELIVSDFGKPYDTSGWYIQGYFENLDTDKKISFLGLEMNHRYDRLVMKLNRDVYDIYYQDRAGQKSSDALNGIDWDNTDFGFCIVPGTNHILFDISYDIRVLKGSYIQFLYKTLGV